MQRSCFRCATQQAIVWRSAATCVADSAGAVALVQCEPIAGTYHQAARGGAERAVFVAAEPGADCRLAADLLLDLGDVADPREAVVAKSVRPDPVGARFSADRQARRRDAARQPAGRLDRLMPDLVRRARVEPGRR